MLELAYNIDIMGESVLHNLIDLQMFILRLYIEQENYLRSIRIKGGMLIIEDSTMNRYVHNRTEGLKSDRPVNNMVCKIRPLIVIISGTE